MIENKYVEDLSLEGRKKEIDIKIQRIHEMLDERSMDAVLLRKHPNYSWITAGGKNFVANCFDEGAVAILITRNYGNHALCNVIEEARLIDEEYLPELGFELHVYPWQEDQLLSIIQNIVPDVSKIVSDSSVEDIPARADWIAPLRWQLTDNEIARYLHLGTVMSGALEDYLATVRPGMTEYEIAGGISAALWPHNIEQIMHLVSVDERADKYRHALPTDKKLENNLLVSINGRYKGLVVTTSRMVYFGKPSAEFLQQYRDCCEMENDTIAKAAVGVDEKVLYDTLKQAYVNKGYPTMFDKHGQGGCQGYWPREYMITPTNHNVIKENQAYCFNPVVDGTKSEDSFIVTNTGPIMITRPVSFPMLRYNYDDLVLERPDILVVD